VLLGSSRNVVPANRSKCFASLALADLLPRILVGTIYSPFGFGSVVSACSRFKCSCNSRALSSVSTTTLLVTFWV
jgi:hypothetical protein